MLKPGVIAAKQIELKKRDQFYLTKFNSGMRGAQSKEDQPSVLPLLENNKTSTNGVSSGSQSI